jgi:hypothetical protein
MNKFVDQHNPCVLVTMPSLVPLASSQNKVYWHLLYFQNVLWSKNRIQDPFQNKVFTKTCIYKTTGI